MNTHRTRIKICGLRNPEHARVAADAGADAVGVVFHPSSPRSVSLEEAAAVAAAVPPFVTTVGLFVNATEERVREVLAAVPLGLLQFHGDETPEFCARFNRPWIRAVRVGPGVDLLEWQRQFHGAQGLLADSHVAGTYGGTGTRFDWSLIPHAMTTPIILSGGLDAMNVGGAISAVLPWAVDVSSGVERERGVKDVHLIQEFVRSVKNADARTYR